MGFLRYETTLNDVDWVEYVNTPIKEGILHAIRNYVNRQAPLGDKKWQVETSTKYGILSYTK